MLPCNRRTFLVTFLDGGHEYEIVTTKDLEIYSWEGEPVIGRYIPSLNVDDFFLCREITND